VRRLAHRPRPQEGALLGAGAVDVGGGQALVARAERKPARARVLGLDARDLPRDVGGMRGRARAVQKLRGGPSAPDIADPGGFAGAQAW
jgi:hypothetical protein